MSFYYPPLNLESFLFAYPDEESLRLFFNQTLGKKIVDPREDVSVFGQSLLIHLKSVSVQDANRFASAFCVKGMADNVAALACWLAMKTLYQFQFSLEEIAHPFSETQIYENRPLALALTNDLFVDEEGAIAGDMDPESMGLIDAARRTVNQYRQLGSILSPIHKVDDNFMNLVDNLKRQHENKNKLF